MTAVGYLSDIEEIIPASWSNCLHDGAAAFKLSKRSLLPPTLCAKDLPGGQTQISNVRRIRRINHHPAESDQDSAPESISDTENWLHWNGDLDPPNASDDDCDIDITLHIELDNRIEAPESPEHRDMSAARNFPRLILATCRSMKSAVMWLMTVTAMETRMNQGNTKK